MRTRQTNLPFSDKSPQALREEFSGFFGPRRFARIVWQAEERDGRKANFDVGGSSRLLALDTRDGEIRELVPPRAGAHWSSPTFTWDGGWIAFTDSEGKRTCAVRWDGSGEHELLPNSEGDGRCWQCPEGKQWVITTQRSPRLDERVAVWRVNVNDSSDRVLLFTTRWPRPDWAGATCWASMSVDGKRMAAGFPNYDDVGVMDLASGEIGKFPINGCWPSIARDNSYDVLYTNSGERAHVTIRMLDRDQKEILLKDLRHEGVLNDDEFFESLRWTSDRDFVTFSVYRTGFLSAGLPAPRILRLSDMHYVTINQCPATPEGNADIFFYDESTP